VLCQEHLKDYWLNGAEGLAYGFVRIAVKSCNVDIAGTAGEHHGGLGIVKGNNAYNGKGDYTKVVFNCFHGGFAC
jgi:hypothetical protein